MLSTIAVVVLCIIALSLIIYLYGNPNHSYFEALIIAFQISLQIGITIIVIHFAIKYW